MSAALLTTLMVASAPQWIMMPVRAEHAPPSDPTLLRTTRAVARALADQTSANIRVFDREKRDEHCSDDGHRCPEAIARILEVDRVIALELSDDHTKLQVYIYERRPPRLANQLEVGCEWDEGPRCEAEKLAKAVATERPDYDEATLEAAWSKLVPRIRGCFTKAKPVADAKVTFSLRPSGRLVDVRVEPRKLQRKRPYACAARVVESLRVPPFKGKAVRLERPLNL